MIALSLELLAAIRAGEATGHWFLEFDHPLGVVRAWSGIGDRTFLGATYQGIGLLGSKIGKFVRSELSRNTSAICLPFTPSCACSS